MEDFTKAKTMTFPRQVLAGHDVLRHIGNMCKSFNLKGTALIVTGETTGPIAGNEVKDSLTSVGYDVQSITVRDATIDNVNKVSEFAKQVSATFILGVGGGSKIDIAKTVAKEHFIEFISVPTSGSHDGIASPNASIKGMGKPTSVEAVMPLAVIADTAVIIRSPFRLLASGCADVLSNLTALRDWELAVRLRNEEFSNTAYTLARVSANEIMQNAHLIKPNNEESAWVAIKPIISSGISMSIANSSRPTSGSEHMFSHALDEMAPGKGLHGEKCGVGSIMMMYLHGGPWEEIRTALRTFGAPTTARDLGLSNEEVIAALVKAHTVRDRYTILGERGLSRDVAENLARKTGVIG